MYCPVYGKMHIKDPLLLFRSIPFTLQNSVFEMDALSSCSVVLPPTLGAMINSFGQLAEFRIHSNGSNAVVTLVYGVTTDKKRRTRSSRRKLSGAAAKPAPAVTTPAAPHVLHVDAPASPVRDPKPAPVDDTFVKKKSLAEQQAPKRKATSPLFASVSSPPAPSEEDLVVEEDELVQCSGKTQVQAETTTSGVSLPNRPIPASTRQLRKTSIKERVLHFLSRTQRQHSGDLSHHPTWKHIQAVHDVGEHGQY